MYYEPFTSALHEVIKDFKLPVNELGYFVTRIEEEHLWVSTNINFKLDQKYILTNACFHKFTKKLIYFFKAFLANKKSSVLL